MVKMKGIESMKKGLLITLAVVLLVGVVALAKKIREPDPYVSMYADKCSTCHGDELAGTASLGPALVGGDLKYGSTVADINISIAQGFPTKGMPAWSNTLDDDEIKGLAIYVAERRVGRKFTDFKNEAPLVVPTNTIKTELHDFRMEVVTSSLHPFPFSIAPLPDGRILVTEKNQGLRIVSTDGALSELVKGTPLVHDDGIELFSLDFGLGWLLDVALHPQYAENGWIYLHYTERCADCSVLLPTSFNKLVRARIKDGEWVDEETIWSADKDFYSPLPDMGAGGRITFDDQNHVYMSIGVKGKSNYHGIQDLSTPYGKIHRMHDDGGVPTDNPFLDTEGAFKTIWTYGHRSPQGLEFNFQTGQLWGTEMGPRGGDELNLLLPGRNYGWPLYSLGLDYDGSAVEYGNNLDIEFDLKDIEQPVVDLTPSPAVSSFIFYDGDQFPKWKHNALVGSLKATELYRMVLDGNKLVHMETVIKGLARIRDIEMGADGNIYLLLEHSAGGQIIRLVPVTSEA